MQVRYGDLGIAMELEWGADGPQPYTTWLLALLCAAFLAGGTLTLAQPGVSPPVGAAMEPPYGGEVVYADQANGPLRVWPEVHPGTACCGDRSPIQPLHLVSTVVGDCRRKTNMMC